VWGNGCQSNLKYKLLKCVWSAIGVLYKFSLKIKIWENPTKLQKIWKYIRKLR